MTPVASPTSTKGNLVSFLEGKHSQKQKDISASRSLSLKCKVCDKVANSLTQLRRHYSLAHNSAVFTEYFSSLKSKGLYSCPKCDKKFFSNSSISRHYDYEHSRCKASPKKGEKNVKPVTQTCRNCGKNFNSRTEKSYIAHTKVCQAKQRQNAKLPGKPSTTTFQPTSFCCILRGKTFALKKNLKRHLICAHKLTKEEVLYNLSDKPLEAKEDVYLCKICKVCFPTEKAYKVHQFRRHKRKSGFFQCRICLNKFKTGHKLKSHMRTSHKGRLLFLCRACSKEFNSEEDILSHKCRHTRSKLSNK